MPNGGTLTIETSNIQRQAQLPGGTDETPGNCWVCISVSDTGLGMDEETLARVFEPFFTTKDVGKGTGLGLSQVYGFVKQSGGTIRLTSAPGAGTTATICLPRIVAARSIDATPLEPAVTGRGGTETVLVVEDEDNVRAFSVAALRALGYRVLETADGPSALELLKGRSEPVDLLFTDVVLPNGLNGPVLAEEAVALRPAMKVLFTTGYSRNAVFPHSASDAQTDLINKPFTYSDLATKVREVLDRGSAGRKPATPAARTSEARASKI
jgi:CheY-like chemotaxis protein